MIVIHINTTYFAIKERVKLSSSDSRKILKILKLPGNPGTFLIFILQIFYFRRTSTESVPRTRENIY